jgi:hypothetical protein
LTPEPIHAAERLGVVLLKFVPQGRSATCRVAIVNTRGAIGLYEAIFIATILSLILLSARFLKVSRPADQS